MRRIVRYSKAAIQSVFERFGYRLRLQPLRKVHPEDVRNAGNDPRALHYYTNNQVLLNAPVSKGFGLDHYPARKRGPHPFVRASLTGLNSAVPKKDIRGVLEQYYRCVQPESAAEWMGFSPHRLPGLADEPPWGRVFPWRSTTVEAMKRGIEATATIDNAQGGKNLTIEHGWRSFGPVSDEILEIETTRIMNLIQSVERNGIQRNNLPGGDIIAIALVDDDGDWRWLVEAGGEHRLPVLAAMGYKEIPIRVRLVIYRNDVDIWPNVNSGLYSRDVALEIFDRYFQESYPPIVQRYLDVI